MKLPWVSNGGWDRSTRHASSKLTSYRFVTVTTPATACRDDVFLYFQGQKTKGIDNRHVLLKGQGLNGLTADGPLHHGFGTVGRRFGRFGGFGFCGFGFRGFRFGAAGFAGFGFAVSAGLSAAGLSGVGPACAKPSAHPPGLHLAIPKVARPRQYQPQTNPRLSSLLFSQFGSYNIIVFPFICRRSYPARTFSK